MREFWKELDTTRRTLGAGTHRGLRRAVSRNGILLGAVSLGAIAAISLGLSACDHGTKASAISDLAATDARNVALAVPARAPAAHTTLRLDPIEVRRDSHPLDGLARAELADLVVRNPSALGSMSLGRPNRGRLVNAVQMPEGRLWKLAEPKFAWGTTETIQSIQAAILRVEADHPGSNALYVGHISREQGGWLRPHRSHQSGRDADLGYYYTNGERWYAKPTAEDLDRARTWTLLLGLVAQGNVEYVFMDRNVQALLVEYARSIGTDEAFLGELFSDAAGSPTAVVRHRWGHYTHLHVRFYSDEACEAGLLASEYLGKNRKI